MYILGINAYHGDSSACLVKDGELVAALEEERLRRVKHWAGLPTEAIRFCLDYAGIELGDVDYIALGRNPRAHLVDKVWFTLKTRPQVGMVADRVKGLVKIKGIADALGEAFDIPKKILAPKIRNVEHHKAHLASTFFVSPFEKAAVVSIDGMGDFVSTMWGVGEKNKISAPHTVMYPHSLGFFYTALTQYLGFWKYGDEYKVMGLAGFGDKERYEEKLRKLIRLERGGKFSLDLKYFVHHKERIHLDWDGKAPAVGKMFSPALEELLGPARSEDEPLDERFEGIAAATQAVFEQGAFHILREAHKLTGLSALCLAGGTAQNSVVNGRVFEKTPFRDLYVPPAAHDAGTAIGAAFWVYHEELEQPRTFEMTHALWGPEYSDDEIEALLREVRLSPVRVDDNELISRTAKLLEEGKIVGWFQGRSEWGPRALGNRSILANPTRPDMKEILNVKIKRREPFRPFAPSILEEHVDEYFEEKYPVPFMEKVYMVRPEKRETLPAVVHVDGTGRLQSVSKDTNPRYWKLIRAFGDLTGVPIVLNTSFNENEPIVNHPKEAINCFLRTGMDVLVMGNVLVERT